MKQQVGRRLVDVRQEMADVGCESLIISKQVNVRWLTGFTGSNGVVVVGSESLHLVTDSRYDRQAADEMTAAGVSAEITVTTQPDAEMYQQLIGEVTSVGLEAEALSWQKATQLADWLPGVDLIATSQLCENLRRYKDAGEISLLEKAAAIADQALAEVVPGIVPGRTEKQIAAELDNHMRLLGADKPSYDTIVASGPNSALPHAQPTSRLLETGDIVIIDVGARLDGYGSDMTRTFVVGGAPSVDQQRLFDAVTAAQKAGIDAVKVGVAERHIDDVCRSVLTDYGLVDAFIHGTGHGIGLEIHEKPILSPRSVGTLHAGLVVTIEPGVYVEGIGGVRIEDAVVVTGSGSTMLTHSPYE